MRSLFKRTIATLLVVAMLTMVLASCQTESTNTDTAADSTATTGSEDTAGEETGPIELTAFAMSGPYTTGDFNDLALWSVVEEATGVKVDFEAFPFEAIEEKRSLLFATNDLPDMFFKTTMSTEDITRYSTEGQLVPIDGYFAEYAPNLSSFMADDPAIEKGLKMADGKIYGFPYLVTSSPSRINPKIFVNEAWLTESGNEMPTTLDELYELAVEFKDSDWNANGEADEIPLGVENYLHLQSAFLGAFGLMNRGGSIIDGKTPSWDIDPETSELRFFKTSDEYMEFLQFLNKLYTEKLISQEIFTDDLTIIQANAENNVYGFSMLTNSSYLGSALEDFTHLPTSLEGPNGDNLYSPRSIPLAGQNTFLTSANENPEASIAFVDYFYSQEGIRTYFMGIEGETWEMGDDGKPVFTDFVKNNPDGLNMEEALGSYVCWSGGSNPSVADNTHFADQLINESTVNAALALIEYTPQEVWGQFPYTAEQVDELKILQNDIDTYVLDSMAKFITGEMSFDQWDSYVAQVEDYGLAEYTAIQQVALDAYLTQ